jgi:hypothetical protein
VQVTFNICSLFPFLVEVSGVRKFSPTLAKFPIISSQFLYRFYILARLMLRTSIASARIQQVTLRSHHIRFISLSLTRSSITPSATSTPDALVLPVFPKRVSECPPNFASSLNLPSLWSNTRAKADKALETRVFHQENGPTISLVALGKESDDKNVNKRREASRKAIATGVKAARDAGARSIGVVTNQILEHDAG